MNSFLNITKINLLTFLDIYKLKNANTKEAKIKESKKLLFVLFTLFMLAFAVYYYAEFMIEGFIQMEIPYIILAQFMAIISIIILTSNAFRINSAIFNFKDYDLLFSLPIKKSSIILSKLVHLYVSNLIYELIFFVPIYILYIQNVKVDLIFHPFYFVTLLVIPIVPIIIATIIGSLLSGISSIFKYKNIINILLSVFLMVVVFYFSYQMENTNSVDIANLGNSFVEMYNKFYPLTGMYIEIIRDYNLISLLQFILIPVLLLISYILIIIKFYNKIHNNLRKETTKSNFKLKSLKTNSQTISLYKKELKRYFSSINYFLNTSMGSIMLTLSILCFILLGSEKLNEMIGISNFSEMFTLYGPIMLGSFTLLNCSTHPSISLEGRNAWIMKSLPVSPMQIFISKIMVNLTILVPTIFINASILLVYLNQGFNLYLYITPLLYALFISILGIIVNMHFVNFNYENEIKVIKQSPAALITLSIGAILAILPFLLNIELNVLYITLIALVLNVLSYLYMAKISAKILKNV